MMPPHYSLPAPPHFSSENSPGQIPTLFAGLHLNPTLRCLSSDYLRLLSSSQSQLRSKMEELKSGSILMWSNMCSKKCLPFGRVHQPAVSLPQLSLFSGKGFDGNGGFLSSIGSFFNNIQRDSKNRRSWTDVLLGVNALTYAAQMASRGRLAMWGAKVNCYSLNSIGPAVEYLMGPRRFLEIYFSSALTSSLMSYHFCPSPSLGASGAVCGLFGAYAVYIWRNRSRIRNGDEQLQRIAYLVALNMVIGLSSKGIDNWGHLGGLLGGVAMSLLLNPS